MRITLKTLIIEGFGSIIKPLVYRLDTPGITSLSGKNGSGKSTIANALCWVTYKQLAKKGATIQTWPHVGKESYMGTRVSLSFSDGKNTYKIIRCLEYQGSVLGKKGGNRLVLIKNKKVVNTERNKSDQENWIKEKLGYSFELFKNTVIFGQSLTRITSEDGPTKKRVFEEAFDTVFITKAKEIVSKKLDEDCSNSTKLQITIQGEEKLLDSQKEFLQNMKNLKKEWLNKKTKRLEEWDEKIAEALEEINDSKKRIEKATLGKGIVWIMGRKDKLTKKSNPKVIEDEFKQMIAINNLKQSQEKIWDLMNGLKTKIMGGSKKCEYCGSILNKEKAISQKKRWKNELSKLQVELSSNKDKLITMEEEYEDLKEKIKEQENIQKKIVNYARIISAVSILQEGIRQLILKRKSYIKEVEKIHAEECPGSSKSKRLELEKTISESHIKLEGFRNELASITKQISINEWLLKDPLSNSGLKAYIFDSMLERVNKYCNDYSSITGFRINVYIDMSTAHKNIDVSIFKNDNEVPYKDLSGGQKQLVDITMAFALNDTVNSVKPINILFLDEVFESLDSDNIELVENLIKDKSHKRTIHVISHRSSFLPSNSNTIELELNSKGQTVLV